MAEPHGPTITFVRLYADESGESHFAVQEYDRSQVGERSELMGGTASRFSLRVVPPGWERDWGPTSRPTLAVYVAGEGIVEASDGDRHHVRPGVFLLAEDTHGVGHRAAVVGERSLTVMHIMLDGPLG